MEHRDPIHDTTRDEANPPASTDEVAGFGELLDTAMWNVANTPLPPVTAPTPFGGLAGGVLPSASTAKRLN